MTFNPNTEWLAGYIAQFRSLKAQADTALGRMDDACFFTPQPPEPNSIAIVVKHLAGNLASRWRDFLTSDGEKPDRHREREFILETGDDRAALMARWEAGWATLFGTLEALSELDLTKTITIRQEPLSVPDAILRAHEHTAGHVQHIVWVGEMG